MDETLHFIDSYFQNGLSEAEKQRFEERCQHEEAFADAVAFYVMSREAAREELLVEKTKAWTGEEERDKARAAPAAPLRKMPFSRWAAYAAAACVTIFIGLYFLYPSATPQSLAHTYVQENLSHIPQTMDGSRDSLQKGIGAYNSGNYTEALALFSALYEGHPDNSEALEYAGRAYLRQKKYNEALAQFTQLANKKLVSNAGLFLKAVTLLERNAAGDKEIAKGLLERVRNEKLENGKEAAEWLRKW